MSYTTPAIRSGFSLGQMQTRSRRELERTRQGQVARSIVAMLLRQARADRLNVQRAQKLQNPVWIAQTTSVWCTSSGVAEIARRMLYNNSAQVD